MYVLQDSAVAHSRAYIHHLLLTQELTGFVLLASHNLAHYLRFFAEIRRQVRDLDCAFTCISESAQLHVKITHTQSYHRSASAQIDLRTPNLVARVCVCLQIDRGTFEAYREAMLPLVSTTGRAKAHP